MTQSQLAILGLCLLPVALFANTLSMQNTPHWQSQFTAFSLMNAGTNTYGDQISSGNNNQVLEAQNNNSFSYQLSVSYFKQKSSWSLSYANYSPSWRTNSTSNTNYNGNIDYSGQDEIQEFTFQHGYAYFINQLLSVNLHAGFSYLTEKSNTNFNGHYVGTSSQFKHGESQFSGSGPNVGLTLIHQMGKHFSFSNTANIGLYYGSFNASSTTINNAGTVTAINTDPKHSLLVPSIDVNFTFGYHYQFKQQHIFHTELGVQFKQLFNAAKTHEATSSTYENVAFYGPFLRLGYLF